jgi:hypothetical protein
MPPMQALRDPASQGISIELSPAQIDKIVREAAAEGSISVLLSGLAGVWETDGQLPHIHKDVRLSRSLLAGLRMLACFPADGSYIANTALARKLDMNASTAHRYVTTLVATGLVARDPTSRLYKLTHTSTTTRSALRAGMSAVAPEADGTL